uniref:Secreted protein n=1 Tax=Globodera pallida TaxID=36090 RepID=A0A183BWM7_GLOPA
MNKWTTATQIVFCLLLLVVVGGTFRFPSAPVHDLRQVSALPVLGLNRFRHVLVLPPFLFLPPTPVLLNQFRAHPSLFIFTLPLCWLSLIVRPKQSQSQSSLKLRRLDQLLT